MARKWNILHILILTSHPSEFSHVYPPHQTWLSMFVLEKELFDFSFNPGDWTKGGHIPTQYDTLIIHWLLIHCPETDMFIRKLILCNVTARNTALPYWKDIIFIICLEIKWNWIMSSIKFYFYHLLNIYRIYRIDPYPPKKRLLLFSILPHISYVL